MHDRPESVPAIGRLSGPGAAATGPANRRTAAAIRSSAGSSRSSRLLGTPVDRFKHMMKRVEPGPGRCHDRSRQHGHDRRCLLAAAPVAGSPPLRTTTATSRCWPSRCGRDDLHRRLHEGRSAGGPGRGGRGRAGGQEAAEADAQPGRRRSGARCLPASRASYKPEDLVGRLVVCVANLAPRQMKFGLSEGMIVAAGGGRHRDLSLVARRRGQAGTPGALGRRRGSAGTGAGHGKWLNRKRRSPVTRSLAIFSPKRRLPPMPRPPNCPCPVAALQCSQDRLEPELGESTSSILPTASAD